jgi:ferredoxin-NADP reductase
MAIIKKYRSEVRSIDNPLPEIFTVLFKSLEKKFSFKPGQYLHLAIDEYNPSLPWPDSRCFSMQSSPSEDEIRITFSLKGNFTGRMSRELSPGKIVYLKMPYGDFLTRPHSEDNCVFIAGGTGITPFLSLFTHESFSAFKKPRLYFGVRNESYNIYSGDIKRSGEINSGFECFTVKEDIEGILNIEKIFGDNGLSAVYFVSGPPVMIKKFREYLLTHGVTDSNIVTDDWE